MTAPVVHVGPSRFARGGVARVIALLGESGLAERYRILFVATVGRSAGPLAYAAFPLALARVAWLIWFRRVRLVHLHTASRGSFRRKRLVSRLATMSGAQYAVHLHGGGFADYYAEASSSMKSRILDYFSEAALVFVVSEAMASFVRDTLGVACPVVVPNPVAIPAETTSGADSGRVVSIGHLGPLKGTDVLIEAMEAVVRRVGDVTLLLIGDGLPSDLRERAESGPLAGRVAMRGWMTPAEVEAELSSSAVFALPSRAEGMPLSLLEAMACGLACVATPVGGVTEVIEHGVTGLIVAPDDPAALERALVSLLTDASLRHSVGAAAHERVRGHSIEHAVEVITRSYESIGLGGGEGVGAT